MHCTTAEIAAFFDCSRDTIEGRFSAELNKGRQQGKMKLRDMQLKCAEKGNVAMLIFLGKQYLGQSDKIEERIETKDLGSDSTIDKLVGLIIKEKK